MCNSSGEVVIKIDPNRNWNDLSLGTQLVPPGVGIPRHVHAYWDEAINRDRDLKDARDAIWPGLADPLLGRRHQ
jgi:hypothetical protein